MNSPPVLNAASGSALVESASWDVSFPLRASKFASLQAAASDAAIADTATPRLDPALQSIRSPHPRIHAEIGRYRLRLAHSVADRDAVCRLRFKVFNIELGKGLEASYATGLDVDQFDLFCDHLLVEDLFSGHAVGTYRMQSGTTAERNLGYYSEQEFDFSPYRSLRSEILELGRASIDREHRTPEVLTLLWRGIAQYARDMQLRYLVGCSSLNTIDACEGWRIYRQLTSHRVAEELTTQPHKTYLCPASKENQTAGDGEKIPKLLRTYLALGARICSTPAWDGEFGTIDFLTLLDLKTISSSARNRFLAPLAE